MNGRRVDADPNEPNKFPFPRLEPGDYGKDLNGIWYCRPPWKHSSGCLGDGSGIKGHTIKEYEDGTITVSPSILIKTHVGDWHGFLENGIWKEC